MSDIKGKLITCNRCGETVFVKLIGKDYFDGGYSSRDKFEEPPEGWQTWICIEQYTCLCPECYKEWQEVRKKFFAKLMKEGVE